MVDVTITILLLCYWTILSVFNISRHIWNNTYFKFVTVSNYIQQHKMQIFKMFNFHLDGLF